MESQPYQYNVIFIGYKSNFVLKFKTGTKIKYIIEEYFKKIKKENLLLKNIDNIYFIYDSRKLDDYKEETMEYLSHNNYCNFYKVNVVNGREDDYNYQIVDTIKTSFFTSVFKAKIISMGSEEFVAVKKIFKDKIKEEMKYLRGKLEITDEEFKPEIEKFNSELENMKLCQCKSSVKIYDYYETEKEFVIIMELCDETLFHELIKTENGFDSEQIKVILLQLNEVFKIMNAHKISHRDIKLNNILVKYLDEQKTIFRVLLSDYGISNRLVSLSRQFSTHVGNSLMMAPEILKNEKYNEKCDLWSLGVIIYQLYTKRLPYNGEVQSAILKDIKDRGQTILDIIRPEDQILKNLLSKLLVENPEKRISWEQYFKHPFFNDEPSDVETNSCLFI